MTSLWSKSCQLPKCKTLSGDLRAQNVVIGAGIAGCLIAYFLQEKGQEVIVLEANEIASGQTKNTTAKITSQHGLIYSDMVKNVGVERARGYAKANEAAIKRYKEIITKEGIACHFEELPSFLYTIKNEGVEKLKREAEVAKALGIEAEYITGEKITELPFGVTGAVCFEHQAQFHPLEFLEHIAAKLTIYEHTKVLEVDDHFVITDKGMVVAENVIFATHYPFPIVPGYYFARQHQSRSYVLALEGEGVPKKLQGMYYGIEKEDISFRSGEGKLIFGGGGHRTGKDFEIHKGNGNKTYKSSFCYLREKAKEYYENANETAYWAAEDCMPHDGIPFIGRFSIQKENWYVATGFRKWGMTTAMVAAWIISDTITGKENEYAYVFTPQRVLWKAGYKAFLLDVWESTIGLMKGLFVNRKRKCTHMGCALTWNEEEKSWDCSCHGSRFREDGNVIDGPAQNDTGA